MKPLKDRLDSLATSALRDTTLVDPSRRRTAARRHPVVPGIPIAIVCLALVAVALWQFGNARSSDLVVVGDDGQPVASQPAAATCNSEAILTVLRSGLPTYDYQPAGSYAALATNYPDVVAGRVTTAVRTIVNGSSYTELTVADVTDLDGGARPDVDVIAYPAAWAGRSNADPLATARAFDDVYFFAFLTPWSGVRGGWNPDVEGLYITCGETGALSPVIEDASGIDEAPLTTIEPLMTVLRAERDRETLLPTPAPRPLTPQDSAVEADAAMREREAEVTVDPAGLMAIRDALVQFARGENLAIEEIPLDAEVALGLGSGIYRTEAKDTLRAQSGWQIDDPAGYEGFVGPFSALDTLGAAPETQIIVGEHPHCAGEALHAPVGFEHHLQVSIQPAEGTIDSCITWFSVDLFFNVDTMAIAAVTLSLFGP